MDAVVSRYTYGRIGFAIPYQPVKEGRLIRLVVRSIGWSLGGTEWVMAVMGREREGGRKILSDGCFSLVF